MRMLMVMVIPDIRLFIPHMLFSLLGVAVSYAFIKLTAAIFEF
jgi:hypothetical protein